MREQPVQQVEDWPHEEFEPAPVDRLGELGDARVLISVEPHFLLRAGEQMGLGGQRLCRCHDRRSERVIGLVSAAGRTPEIRAHRAFRRQRGQPIFVGEAEPPVAGCELLARLRLVEGLPGDLVVRGPVEHADRADVDRPAVGIDRLRGAAHQADRADHDRFARTVHDPLIDREQIAVVDRDLHFIAHAVGALGRQGHGMAGRQQRAIGGPHGVEVGNGDVLSDPAERGDIGSRRSQRREQPHRGRILLDRLALANHHEIVDLRTLEIERALERRRFNPHARSGSEHRRAALQGSGCRGDRASGSLGHRHLLPIHRLGARRVGGREIFVRRPRPAEQDQCADHHREDHILAIGHLKILVMVPGRGLGRPTGGNGRCVSAPASSRAARHSVAKP